MITSNQHVLIADTRKYSILRKQDLQGFVQSGQFVQLMDGPHALLTVDSVMFCGTLRCIFESRTFPCLLLFAQVSGKTLRHTLRKASLFPLFFLFGR